MDTYTKDELKTANDLQLINTKEYYYTLLHDIKTGLINAESKEEIELHLETIQKELDRRYK